MVKQLKLLSVLKQPKYFLTAIFSSIAMLSIYIFTQLLGIIQNIGIWIATIPWYNAILLSIFTILFGITFAYQISLWFGAKTCPTNIKIKGTGASSIATIGAFFVAQCPACASLGALFLPISATVFLAQYSWALNILSISLILFTLNYLGAFKNN